MSRPAPLFAAHVDGAGQLVLDDFGLFQKHVARYRGQRVNVTVKRATSVRTLEQNRRLWYIYGVISDWCGHDPNELHEWAKKEFLPPQILELPNGKTIEIPPTTRMLGIEEFGDFMGRLEAWAAIQGCLFDWTKIE